MTQEEFADVVLDCKILTQDEAFSVVKFFNSVLSTPVGFPEEKRYRLQHCRRFGTVVNIGSGYPYVPGEKDCLAFTVDKDISLLGVTLCGSKNNTYSVTINIANLDERKELISKAGNFSSGFIRSQEDSYYGFKVFFEHHVLLKEYVTYRIEAFITGPNSCLCRHGKHYVACSGVTFDFRICCSINNGTTVRRGQFPEILFTV